MTAVAESPARAPTQVEALARFWANARFQDMPADAVAKAKRFLLDTLAAGIAGAQTEVAEAALKAAQAESEASSGSAVLWGRAETLPPPLAAMVNGTMA